MQWNWLWVFIAGMVASFINTFAGGGSLITLPFLMFLGLPASLANGTNKIGLMAGTSTAMVNFTRKKILHWRDVLYVAPFGMAGGILGYLFSINLSESLYRILLSCVMIMVLVLILVRPQRFMKQKERDPKVEQIMMMVAFFLIGFYGGFIQAGMGYLVILALSFIGDMDLVKISGYKATMGFVIVFFSAWVFIFNGKIDWPLAVFLAAGNALGAFIGSHIAMKGGEKVIRPILAVVVSLMAVKLSGLHEILFPRLFG
ncbi:MAG: sulfite exporter TauE/SafE family protein [Spirochaetaceae bacterium]|jgi:uncharacterized membrane protein YfcA|nr:sulfite exporter TauE/SafE family protein [Spirochaetaceae bacterium]